MRNQHKATDMSDIVITGAKRTAIGAFMGQFSSVSSAQLGACAIRAALEMAGVEAAAVSDVIMGNVLTAGQGQGPARQAAVQAGIPYATPALTINHLCGSGLRAVALATQALQAGDAEIVVAGGQENMSQAPHCQNLRLGSKLGNVALVDTLLKDGLTDAFVEGHMGLHTEKLAAKYGITRAAQDAFALLSQSNAAAAMAAGRFAAEIAPVRVQSRKGDVEVAADEYPKPETTLETLSKLPPAFDKAGTITAGNASGINDGAAALVLMRRATAQARGAPVLARVVSHASVGIDPVFFGAGPVQAVRVALKKAGWQIDDVELIEANEAFAAQSLVVMHELGLNPDRVNVNGGAIALGHPIGASGARVLVTLLHEMARRGAKKGLATLCIGGGMGIALCVERD